MRKVNNPRLLIIIWFLLLSSCQSRSSEVDHHINILYSPGELSDGIHDISIFFFKSSGFGSEINIRNLVNSNINHYQNAYYIPFLDVSDDGQNIVFAQIARGNDERPFLLWLYKFSDGKERKIAGWDYGYSVVSISNPAFSYDENNILFSVTWFSTGRTGLARVNRDGSDLVILETDIPLAEGPEPSPDGSMILVTCAGVDKISGNPAFHICLLDQEGSFIKFISDTGDVHGSYYFLPNGKSIVYNELRSGGIFGILNKPEYYFYLYDLDSGERIKLLDWEVIVKGFSNDSEQIIFQGRPKDKSPWGIYIMNTDGTNLRHLAYFDEFLEDWYSDNDD